ncbi:MAG: hypothetical protein KGL39_18840 [Patescibacteria group bacterium]|nr:hypothetical protein [Patescibacteria group bacterium]
MADDYNDYDPAEDAGFDDTVEVDEAPDDASEPPELEENEESEGATDSDSEGEDEEEDEDEAAETPDDASTVGKPLKAKAPAKQRVDPIAKFSSTQRTVIIVAPEDRQTSNLMTPEEEAMAIGIRAQQLENFSQIFVKDEKSSDAVKRAAAELRAGKCPLKLRRFVGWGPNGEKICEEWSLRELALPKS